MIKKGIRLSLIIVFSLSVMLLSGCNGDTDKADQYTIGIINLTASLDPIISGFKSKMTELGYVEGENLTYIYDGPAASIANLDDLAQKLVEADVDLILCVSTPAAQAVQRATTEKPIPCVFAPVQAPIISGLVPSLQEPGGNLTGITFGTQEGKRLEWLTRVAPNTKRVYIPYNVNDPAPNAALALVSEAADKLDIELVLHPIHNSEEVPAAIENIPDDVDAIMTLPDSIVAQSLDNFIAAAIERNLPYSVPLSSNVTKGALMSYGMQAVPVGEQAARIADQILKGSNPADIPVETAEFFLVINLETANTIGLEIPDSALEQANVVIRGEE